MRKRQQRCRALRFERFEPRVVLSGAHPDNPVLAEEHEAVMNLVPYAAVTHTALKNGDWDNPTIWDHGIPGDNANVLIKEDINVLIDSIVDDRLRTVRVDGALRFSTRVNTALVADTIVVSPTGVLEVGSDAAPIGRTVTAKIIIADTGPINSEWDPHQFSRGLISHGKVEIHGDPTTPYAALAANVTAGATQLVLSSIPVGWAVGERLIVTGTTQGKTHDEVKIASISGSTITLVTPLQFDHAAPPGQSVYVGNVTRNVTIESENATNLLRRGHVMFMHNPDVDIDYAGFYGLGRTDKRNPIHNVQLDADGHAITGTGKNQGGRYSVHFHRVDGVDPVSVQGSAVVDSPGWAIVNHSGNVSVRNNVVFDATGAAYVTEAGDEIGDFTGNLAIYSRGSTLENLRVSQDFGHQGHGFWFQGGGVSVENNIASGQKNSGFAYFTVALIQPGLGTTRFQTSDLVDPSIANGKSTIEVAHVPFRSFAHNVAYASGDGLQTWWHMLTVKHSTPSVVEDFTAWNVTRGIFTPYTNQTVLKNVTLIGNAGRTTGVGIERNELTRNITYENANISGFTSGITIPLTGVNRIVNGTFSNVNNIVITTATSNDRVVDIIGDVTFGASSTFNIHLTSLFSPKEHNITQMFSPDVIRLGTVTFNGKQIYYQEQGSSFVPFKKLTAPAWVPAELIDKTAKQLFETYGLAVGGTLAPPTAVAVAKVRGLVGDAGSYLPYLRQTSAVYTNQVDSYTLEYRDANGNTFVEDSIALQDGWNLVSRQISDHRRTFLIYGDRTAPDVTITSDSFINPLDLEEYGVVVTGKIVDDTGRVNFRRVFNDLSRLSFGERVDGTKFVTVSFTIRDRAGNTTQVAVDVTLDPNAARKEKGAFDTLPERELSETLLALLGL